MQAPAFAASLVAALVCAGTAAFAEPIRLGKNFEPHPLVTAEVKRKTERVYTTDLGFSKCGSSNTTKAPALEFELTESFPELSVRLENRSGGPAGSGGVIRFPDGRYICADRRSEVFFKNWPKGKYKVWLYGPSIGVSAIFRFEVPSRSKAVARRARAKVPTIALSEGARPNPQFLSLKPTRATQAMDAGLSCAKVRDAVMPVARVEVADAAPYFLRTEGVKHYLQAEDGRCYQASGSGTLAAGAYYLWIAVPKEGPPRAIPVEIDDRARPLDFGDAEERAAGSLDAPLVISGTVRAPEPWPSRSFSCRGVARTPDFYLTSDAPLQKVHMSLAWSKVPQELHMFGPITDELTANSRASCHDRGGARQFDVLEGRYAVWVGGGDKAAGSDYHVVVRRTDIEVARMQTLRPIPGDMTLAERAYGNHYPFFSSRGLEGWTELFTTAPDRLFVYPRVDIEERGLVLPAGEPLLVASSNKRRTSVVRYDGTRATVDTRLISADRPAAVVLPRSPNVPEIGNLSSAIGAAGPEDAKAIAAYRAADDKYTTCYFRYMKKHDPTWGKDHDVYRVSASGKVTNVGDQIGKRAHRKCGGARVDRAADKLVRTLAKSRAKRYRAHLAAVRKRFGS